MKIRVNENNVLVAIIYRDTADGIPVKSIPDGVELIKWCYTAEKGFYENPDYTPPVIPDEPVITTEQRLTAAENAIEEIINLIMEG